MIKHRLYNLLLGSAILADLYFSVDYIIYALTGLLLFESVTGILFTRILGKITVPFLRDKTIIYIKKNNRFNTESERAWSLLVAFIFIVSHILFFQQLWFIPWFMGFAILGAGVSGVCPMLIGFKLLGFK